ncbi:hypothetical protein KFU94_00720 [Chloroflexi bacterium TSY]|nr:hypothetical protein [Chloroflexi bacterium TSY]
MLTAPEITIAVLMNVLQVRRSGKGNGRQKLEGYRVKSIDITGFWRPKLQGKVNRLYNSTARRALPALIFGVMISSGEIGGKRVPLLKAIMRCTVGTKESEFRKKLLTETKKSLESDEVAVVDAGFTIREMLEKGKRLEATTPDSSGRFLYSGRLICYQAWHNLVPRTTKVDTANRTYSIYVIQDPAYNTPLVLATVMTLQPETIYLVYLERWPVEPPPLASKQMIGLHRQFVHADEACFRLPELGLLAGNLLSHLAASLPPIPTGYWDREPQATPGRLRRVLSSALFPTPDQLDPDFRKKASVSHHLPKGVLAHRRLNAAA